MIKRIADNESNLELLDLERIDLIKDKLQYYQELLPKLRTLSESAIGDLVDDIRTFFNLKPANLAKELPEYLYRISVNNKVLGNEYLGFLTEIDQILAPPLERCTYNRCNLPKQQILYCATDEITAYWEVKPQKGDVITVSKFKRKENTSLNCSVIKANKHEVREIKHALQDVYYLLDDFFIDVFTMPIDKNYPIDYLFSAVLSSEHFSRQIKSDTNIDAILYPSVQRKLMGYNFAIRNDLIFEKYDLEEVVTHFLIGDVLIINPEEDKLEIANSHLLSSIKIKEFNFKKGKIVYPHSIIEKFPLFRYIQTSGGKQEIFKKPEEANEFFAKRGVKIQYNPYVNLDKIEKRFSKKRNEKITVKYLNGIIKKDIKFKKVEKDIRAGLCRPTEE